MKFQPAICNILYLTNKRSSKKQANCTLEGTVLENVESIKYLGITITNDLKTEFQTVRGIDLSTVERLTRNLCFAVHSERLKKLNEGEDLRDI